MTITFKCSIFEEYVDEKLDLKLTMHQESDTKFRRKKPDTKFCWDTKSFDAKTNAGIEKYILENKDLLEATAWSSKVCFLRTKND